MSWQAYVDDSLVGTGTVSKGALHGLDGNVWATTPGFSVAPAEAKAIIAGFSNPSSIQGSGILANGAKYMTIRAEANSVYGKRGPGGIVCVKTGQAVIIGVYDENIQPGQCTATVEKLGDYLRDQGY